MALSFLAGARLAIHQLVPLSSSDSPVTRLFERTEMGENAKSLNNPEEQ